MLFNAGSITSVSVSAHTVVTIDSNIVQPFAHSSKKKEKEKKLHIKNNNKQTGRPSDIDARYTA